MKKKIEDLPIEENIIKATGKYCNELYFPLTPMMKHIIRFVIKEVRKEYVNELTMEDVVDLIHKFGVEKRRSLDTERARFNIRLWLKAKLLDKTLSPTDK
jgi:hypothetical protein